MCRGVSCKTTQQKQEVPVSVSPGQAPIRHEKIQQMSFEMSNVSDKMSKKWSCREMSVEREKERKKCYCKKFTSFLSDIGLIIEAASQWMIRRRVCELLGKVAEANQW